MFFFKGFCALHHAAAWGRLPVMKILVEFNCDLQQRNVNGERARETAVRYNHTECVDYLDWAGKCLSITKLKVVEWQMFL